MGRNIVDVWVEIRGVGLKSQRNKETEVNNQPLSTPLLFQNEIQKPGQKALKR